MDRLWLDWGHGSFAPASIEAFRQISHIPAGPPRRSVRVALQAKMFLCCSTEQILCGRSRRGDNDPSSSGTHGTSGRSTCSFRQKAFQQGVFQRAGSRSGPVQAFQADMGDFQLPSRPWGVESHDRAGMMPRPSCRPNSWLSDISICMPGRSPRAALTKPPRGGWRDQIQPAQRLHGVAEGAHTGQDDGIRRENFALHRGDCGVETLPAHRRV